MKKRINRVAAKVDLRAKTVRRAVCGAETAGHFSIKSNRSDRNDRNDKNDRNDRSDKSDGSS